MEQAAHYQYERIAEAIGYIYTHFRQQPELDEVARHIHLSPFHFQRLFTDWAGVSPKKFLQFVSVEHAKQVLLQGRTSLADAAFATGLSGTSRLHDLFVQIEGMTPGEYKNGGQNLDIRYSFAETPFGTVLVASTPKGICHMAFAGQEETAFSDLKTRFPNAAFRQMTDLAQQDALYIFKQDWTALPQIKLHLKGTPFQLKVWNTLLRIPLGGLSSYGELAARIEQPPAARAVGSAVGANPVAYLIPCHRVIRSAGELGEYHWGSTRKTAIIGWEMAHSAAG